MKGFYSFLALGALCLSANAASTVDHKGQGMSGEDAYSQVTFTCGQEGNPDETAKAVYTMSSTADQRLSVEARFENLLSDKFIGLVDGCYLFIEGVGETPMTLTDGLYTCETNATLTEGQNYSGWFKRMSSGAWYGGDLLFPFEFTFTAEGGTVTPPDPVEPVIEPLPFDMSDNRHWFGPGWNETECGFICEDNAALIELPVSTETTWQAQFWFLTDITPSADYYYSVAFDADSQLGLDKMLCKLYPEGQDADAIFTKEDIALPEGKKVHVFTCGKGLTSLAELRLLFDFGGNKAGDIIRLSNIRLWRSNVRLNEEPAGDEPYVQPEPVIVQVGSGLKSGIEVKYGSYLENDPLVDVKADYELNVLEDGTMDVILSLDKSAETQLPGFDGNNCQLWFANGRTYTMAREDSEGIVFKVNVSSDGFERDQRYSGFFFITTSKLHYGIIELPFEFVYPGTVALGTIGADETARTEFFTLQGVKVSSPAKGSVVICRRGGQVSKVVF